MVPSALTKVMTSTAPKVVNGIRHEPERVFAEAPRVSCWYVLSPLQLKVLTFRTSTVPFMGTSSPKPKPQP